VDEEEFYGMEDSLNENIGSLTSYALKPSIGKNKIINIEEKTLSNNLNKKNIKDSDVLEAKGINQIKNLNDEIKLKVPKKGKFYEEAYNSKRNSLPCPRKKTNLNVWGILKDAVSKDLSKFCVPGQ